MIKRECYERAGGFPPLVAEDLCLSIEARNAGYFVAFAPNIICREEYPVDYVAFKKRHSKWTQGNLEFIKKYTEKIAKSKMRWFEKMDIVLFTYNLPLTAVFAFFIFVNLTVAPLLGVNLGKVYAPWMIIPTIVFFFSPMLNDFIQWAFRLNPLRTLIYTLSVVALYGSMLTTSLVSALLGIFGQKARFIVTPKSSKKIDFLFALRFQWKGLLFSTFLLAVSLFFHGGVLPVLLIVLTGYASVGLLFFSNSRYTRTQTKEIDGETEAISMRIQKCFVKKSVYAQKNEKIIGK
jgi:cellulose synthase/poly-beta-1,6-N-acetylglucosamine synthase-like glycosyltransferase